MGEKIMRKVKLDTKPEKSAQAFFDNEISDKNEALSFAGSTNILKLEKGKGFIDEHKSLINLLKQVFIFLPGTFLLFFMSFGAAIILMEIIVYRRALETLPDDFPFQFALIGLIVFLGTFMTWFGLGDIKNRKHLAIPASLIVAGAIIGAVVKATANISDLADRMLDDFSYLIYLLPLALIIPILAKSIVDRKTEDA
ncbi:MAG: hypothetical protein LC768_05565 [Acidobacteria bacterium]|nr:hypothetical protein [Acidobacteriota bacterium]MCA1637793.1 hypothetical protein [Acidobacteriota bacterium]